MRPGPTRWQAWRLAWRLVWLSALLLSPTAQATPDCPPVAGPLTATQVQDGLRQARDHGLLWRLEKDGQVGWLYGTLHVGKLAWAFPGPRVTQALRAADTVALELDPTDPTLGPALARGMATLRQREAEHPPPAALAERLRAVARADCVDSPALDAQPLLLRLLSLTTLAGRRDGLDPAYGQEFVLAGFARAAGKALVSLESAEGQLAMLAPADADDDATGLDHALAQLESGQARQLLGRLATLWARGDLDQLAHYERWCDCQPGDADHARLQRLNDGRNPALAEHIDRLLARGQRVFAAVGALHMTGPQALPTLMAQRGWQVRRVVLAPM